MQAEPRCALILLGACALATGASAQDSRHIPAGSPLGAMPIIGETPADDAAGAAASADALLRAQRLAFARARAQAAAQRQAQTEAFGGIGMAAPSLTDDARGQAAAADAGVADAASVRSGMLPTPFGGGIRPNWSNSGITTPWGADPDQAPAPRRMARNAAP